MPIAGSTKPSRPTLDESSLPMNPRPSGHVNSHEKPMKLPVLSHAAPPGLRWAWFTFCSLLAILRAGADTNLVVLGDDLQARIDAAKPGDVMVVQGGTYNATGPLTIQKPLAFVRSGTTPVLVDAPVNIAATGTVSFSRIDFAQALTMSQTSTVVRLHDVLGADFTGTDGALVVRRSRLANLTLSRTKLEALRMTNTGNVILQGRGASQPKVPAVLVQGRCDAAVQASEGMRVVMGYYTCAALRGTDCEFTGVGVQVFNNSGVHRMAIDEPSHWAAAYFRRCKSRWANSQFCFSSAGGTTSDWINPFAFAASDSDTELVNCDVICWGGGFFDSVWRYWRAFSSYGILIRRGTALVQNCYGHFGSLGGSAQFLHLPEPARVTCRDCVALVCDYASTNPFQWQGEGLPISQSLTWVETGPGWQLPINCRVLQEFPAVLSFTNYQSFKLELKPNSGLLNAGSADPIYNNRDGTRNTAGSTGGPLYNPENATTDQPIAFWLGMMPQRIVKGSVSTVKVDAAAAAGH